MTTTDTETTTTKEVAPAYHLNTEELGAVLCALRYWQHHGMPDFHGISTDDGSHQQLTEGEVDQLCEDLNS